MALSWVRPVALRGLEDRILFVSARPSFSFKPFPHPAFLQRRGSFEASSRSRDEPFDHRLQQVTHFDDELFMREALVEAKKAASKGEVPVGAVLVSQGNIIARAHNLVETENDPTAHAEIICIRSAARMLGGWRLLDSTLYVTLEPCPMCAGALLQARVNTLVWGAPNLLLGADGSWVSLFPKSDSDSDSDSVDHSDGTGISDTRRIHPFNPDIKVRRGVLADECSQIMKVFFRQRRKDGMQSELRILSSNTIRSKFLQAIQSVFRHLKDSMFIRRF